MQMLNMKESRQLIVNRKTRCIHFDRFANTLQNRAKSDIVLQVEFRWFDENI